MVIAAGQAEIWVEPYAKSWDLAPIQVITEEAGWCFFNFQGGSSILGENCIYVRAGVGGGGPTFCGGGATRVRLPAVH